MDFSDTAVVVGAAVVVGPSVVGPAVAVDPSVGGGNVASHCSSISAPGNCSEKQYSSNGLPSFE